MNRGVQLQASEPRRRYRGDPHREGRPISDPGEFRCQFSDESDRRPL